VQEVPEDISCMATSLVVQIKDSMIKTWVIKEESASSDFDGVAGLIFHYVSVYLPRALGNDVGHGWTLFARQVFLRLDRPKNSIGGFYCKRPKPLFD